MNIFTPSVLSLIGIVLDVIGFVVLTYDQIMSQREAKRYGDLARYIEKLSLAMDDLAATPIQHGRSSIGGVDMGDAWTIAIEGARAANLDNRERAQQVLDEIERSAETRRWPARLALGLVAFGAILQGIGAALPHS